MKVLITGGLGFIGTEVLNIVNKRRDLEVTVYDNLMHFQNLSFARKRYPNIEFIVGDIRHRTALHSILPRFGTVLHLAAIVGTPACQVSTQFAFDVNVIGTHNLITGMSDSQQLVLLSSTSSYGDKAGELVTENTSLTPLTEYGVHKKINELSVATHGHPNNTLIIRPATAFGPSSHMRLDILPNTLTFEALSTGKIMLFQPDVTRTFIHVQDLAHALVYGLEGKFGWHTSYNIGDPKYTISKGEMAKQIAKLTRAKLEIHDGADPDKRNYEISFLRMLSAGFVPRKTLRSAVTAIRDMLPIISIDPDLYSTARRVERYLLYKD